MFSCEFCEIFKNICFIEHLRITASGIAALKHFKEFIWKHLPLDTSQAATLLKNRLHCWCIFVKFSEIFDESWFLEHFWITTLVLLNFNSHSPVNCSKISSYSSSIAVTLVIFEWILNLTLCSKISIVIYLFQPCLKNVNRLFLIRENKIGQTFILHVWDNQITNVKLQT